MYGVIPYGVLSNVFRRCLRQVLLKVLKTTCFSRQRESAATTWRSSAHYSFSIHPRSTSCEVKSSEPTRIFSFCLFHISSLSRSTVSDRVTVYATKGSELHVGWSSILSSNQSYHIADRPISHGCFSNACEPLYSLIASRAHQKQLTRQHSQEKNKRQRNAALLGKWR